MDTVAHPRPKVSVCVVTYNHERFIGECLQSLVAQSAPFDFEIIVGDDCSTDRTGEIVDRMAAAEPRIRVLRPRRNLGVTQNMLAVHNDARGDYVAHMDGDDLAAPGKLAKQAAALDDDHSLSLCGHAVDFIDEEGRVLGRRYPVDLSARFDIGKLIRCGMPVQASSIMYRRSARRLLKLDFELFDWFFFTDIMRGGDGAFLSEILGSYRINTASLTSAMKVAGMQERMVRLYSLRASEMPARRADFFAWSVGAAWTCLRNRTPVTREHAKLLMATMTPLALPALFDAARWMLRHRTVMVR